MAHAARSAAEATRKASLAAANASLALVSPSSPEGDVFNYDSNDEKTDAEKETPNSSPDDAEKVRAGDVESGTDFLNAAWMKVCGGTLTDLEVGLIFANNRVRPEGVFCMTR